MEWPPSSPDLNLIKNLWSIVKMKLYEGEKQSNNKLDQRKAGLKSHDKIIQTLIFTEKC